MKAATGSSPRAVSVTTKVTPSGVWPGVSSTSIPELLDVEARVVADRQVLESAVPRGRRDDSRARALSELHVPRDEVRVEVCLEDVGDREVERGRGLDVPLDIPGRVDDGARAPGAEEVGTLGDPGDEELLDEHL